MSSVRSAVLTNLENKRRLRATAKLKPGSVMVDLVDGSVHGDLDHCPKEDLLESAQALLSLLPQVRHKGLWGLGKAYDAGCYLYTTATKYKPPPNLHLEADMGYERKFSLKPIHEVPERYWRLTPWSRLVGGVQGDQVSPDTEGKTDHYLPPDPPRVPTPQARRQKAKTARGEGTVQSKLL